MQITVEEFFAILEQQKKLSEQVSALQDSIHQLVTEVKSIMGSFAALQSVDQSLDQAITALSAEEGSLLTVIQSAIAFINNLVSSGAITSAQAQPIITDLQTQVQNIQNVTTSLTGAQTSLAAATAPPSSDTSSAPASSTPATPPAAPPPSSGSD
jgi:vacuolar-type H+-ATPase subunit I/STV1